MAVVMKDRHATPIERSLRGDPLPREREATPTLEPFGEDGHHSDGRDADTQATDEGPGLLARLRELESTTRWLRMELEARNEAIRVLTGRLLALEAAANDSVSDRTRAATLEEQIETLTRERETLTRQRDNAAELANVLQSMKTFRYSKVPRALYGRLRRMLGF
jgi:hypothetical protein